MRVELWTDIICPWCGLGKARFDAALAQFAHRDQVEVIHRSFQLDPHATLGESEPVMAMLARKFRRSEAELQAMTQHVQSLAEAEGLKPYHVGDNRVGNTSPAHEFAHWATDQGKGSEAWALLYRAYFGEKRDIFTFEALAAMAPELGLDAAEALVALKERRYAGAVLEEGEEAQAMGATGVPFFVIDRRFGVSGAQSPEVLLGALQEAWGGRSGAAGDADAACGPEGCAV